MSIADIFNGIADKLESLSSGKSDTGHKHSGGDITSGTVAAARIADLSASKITSGTLGADRIPSLAASKITSGTLGADRIPSLAASKITSGTFDAARIPNLNASKINEGTLAYARGGVTASGPSGGFYKIDFQNNWRLVIGCAALSVKDITKVYGNLYYAVGSVTFPSGYTLKNTKVALVTPLCEQGGLYGISNTGCNGTSVSFYIHSARSESNKTIYVSVIAFGDRP